MDFMCDLEPFSKIRSQIHIMDIWGYRGYAFNCISTEILEFLLVLMYFKKVNTFIKVM